VHPRGNVRAVSRLPLHCGWVDAEDRNAVAESGQSPDCPSIAASSLRQDDRPYPSPGSLPTAPPLRHYPWPSLTITPAVRAVSRLPLHCGATLGSTRFGSGQGPGSLPTAPPLRPYQGDQERPGWYRPGSLPTAPPLRHRGLQLRNSTSSVRAVSRLPLHCGIEEDAEGGIVKRGPGSLPTAPPLRPLKSIRRMSTVEVRAVSRLPLHCGTECHDDHREGVQKSGQSPDCPSIAAPWPTPRS